MAYWSLNGEEITEKVIAQSLNARFKKAQALLDEYGVDALFIHHPSNVFYLSGLRATLAFLILTKEKAYLFTDARYYERTKALAQSFLESRLLLGEIWKTLKKFIHSLRIKKLGVESDYLTLDKKKYLQSSKYKLIPLLHPLQKLRMIKDRVELSLLKLAVSLTDQIFYEILSLPLVGSTELEVRGKIVERIFKFRGEGESFPAIVAYKENSAIPHWECSERLISGEGPLLLDFGLRYRGYASDFTRTIFLGKASSEFRKFYQLVKEAYWLGLSAVKVGQDLREVDRRIREFFSRKGYLSGFIHATGHGIGLDVHEPPRVYENYKEPLPIEEGMVFTIEPGLYFPGNFGIRLENIVFVEGGEGVVYSQVPLELFEI